MSLFDRKGKIKVDVVLLLLFPMISPIFISMLGLWIRTSSPVNDAILDEKTPATPKAASTIHEYSASGRIRVGAFIFLVRQAHASVLRSTNALVPLAEFRRIACVW